VSIRIVSDLSGEVLEAPPPSYYDVRDGRLSFRVRLSVLEASGDAPMPGAHVTEEEAMEHLERAAGARLQALRDAKRAREQQQAVEEQIATEEAAQDQQPAPVDETPIA
jgi:hypothetical protein